ncbi:hypothetical protein [Ornithinibacillus bavariensis]|uniref:hypothetical protein n=1 Tax=Ornithinibacillus bavariensis TaxID=545502 RepID=UPI000EDC30DF|nr:hypothetical protein [Ornithinibacillus sp.]
MATFTRRKIIFLLLFSSVLIFSTFFMIQVHADPTIHAELTISSINQTEWNESIPESIRNTRSQSLDNIRKLEVSVSVNPNWRFSNIVIDIPDLVFPVDHYDGKIRSIRAGEQDGGQYNASAQGYILFDYSGLTEEDVQTMYQHHPILITWDEGGVEKEYKINLSQLID